VFQPTQKWAAELCRGLYHEGAEGVLVVSAEEVPPDVLPTGLLTPLLECREGRCVRAELSPGPQDGDYVLEGAYSDYLKIFEGELPPFAAFAPGKIRLVKGSVSNLPTTCPSPLR